MIGRLQEWWRRRNIESQGKSCHWRQLAFQQCEDRRLLSSSSLVGTGVFTPMPEVGGFLTVSTDGLLNRGASNLLFDGSVQEPFAGAVLWESLDFSAGMHSFDNDQSELGGIPADSPTINQPVLPRDSTEKPVSETPEDAPTGANNNGSHPIVLEDPPEIFPTEVLAGLPAQSARILVIDEPLPIAERGLNSLNVTPGDGGTLEVAAAVATTQRAYQSQLYAATASRLDRGEALPVALPQPIQPPSSELAHAVADTPTGKRNTFIESEPAPPRGSLEPLSLRLHFPSSESAVSHENESEDTAQHTSATETKSKGNLAERVENENQAGHATTFAQWPTLAAVVAGYLLIERSSPPVNSTVQTPPRGSRNPDLR